MPNESPLRVVLLDSIPGWGGGEKWCVQSARALRERGHRVAIACGKGSALEQRATAAEIEVWSDELSGVAALRAAWKLGAWLEHERFELIVANVGRDVRIGAIARVRSRSVLVQRRGIARPIKRDPLSRALYTSVVRGVITNSVAIRETMLAGAPFLERERFHVVENGIDLAALPRRERAVARRNLGLDERAPVAAIVGRLSAMKGHRILLEAWNAVVARVPQAVLLIAGSGELDNELSAHVRTSNLEHNVRFLGFVDEPADVYASADLLVLSSIRDEGASNALLEGMARGLPSVVSDCGGLPETIGGGECGLVVPVADVSALSAAITALLLDSERRARLGAAARARVERHHALEIVTEKLERVLLALRAAR